MKHLLSALLLAGTLLLSAAETLTVIGTTDIHGHIFSAPDKPNLLKLVRAVSEEAEKAGRSNTLLIDCGDLIQGTAETQLDNGKAVLALMNLAKYDVWVPGNHDFELGMNTLLSRARGFGGTFLCGNLIYKNGRPAAAWKLFERAGLKVAVIGITSEHIANWNWRPEETGIKIEETFDALTALCRKSCARSRS